MNGVLRMSTQAICADSRNAISSQALAFGPMPYDQQDGPTIKKSGLEAVHVSHLAQREAEKGEKMIAICGLSSTNLSKHADHSPFLENKSQDPWCSGKQEVKLCKGCKNLVPLTLFARHTGVKLRAVCNPCRAKAAANAYHTGDKVAIAARNKSYQEVRRITQRASYLVTAAKQRAKAKGLPFDLDAHRAELKNVMDQGVCQMTGIPFDMLGKQTWNSPSLDRVIPALGYTISNIRVVLFSLNVMMHDWGVETVKKVATALNKKG